MVSIMEPYREPYMESYRESYQLIDITRFIIYRESPNQ